jgi:NhaP-type Na+/H+ and K+/H+ antiporter
MLVVQLCRRKRQRNRQTAFEAAPGQRHNGALALSVPAGLGGTWIFAATYFVVVFSIIVQGGSLQWVLRRWKARQPVALAEQDC